MVVIRGIGEGEADPARLKLQVFILLDNSVLWLQAMMQHRRQS